MSEAKQTNWAAVASKGIDTVRWWGVAGIVGACIYLSVNLYLKHQPQVQPAPQTDLAALVPSEAHPYLHGFYRDLAHVVSHADAIESTGHFRSTHKHAVSIANQTASLPSVKPIDEPISEMIAAAVGLEDQHLTEAKRAALVGVLEQVAGEFE